jgi:hypothetical protein
MKNRRFEDQISASQREIASFIKVLAASVVVCTFLIVVLG